MDNSLPLKLAKRDVKIRELEVQVQEATNECARLRGDLAAVNEYYMGELEEANRRLSIVSPPETVRDFIKRLAKTKSKFAKEARALLV